VSELQKMLQANEAFATGFDRGDLHIPPARGVAIREVVPAS
jgi:hypothetical protein